MSAFLLEDGVVYHTYSTYARGLDGLWGMYQWLDRAPKGRNEAELYETSRSRTSFFISGRLIGVNLALQLTVPEEVTFQELILKKTSGSGILKPISSI